MVASIEPSSGVATNNDSVPLLQSSQIFRNAPKPASNERIRPIDEPLAWLGFGLPVPRRTRVPGNVGFRDFFRWNSRTRGLHRPASEPQTMGPPGPLEPNTLAVPSRKTAAHLQYKFSPARNSRISYLQLLGTLPLRGERSVGVGSTHPLNRSLKSHLSNAKFAELATSVLYMPYK